MQIKTRIKEWCPPIILKLWRFYDTHKAGVCQDVGAKFSGDYWQWEDALRDSDGYDAQIILDKTLNATLKVKNGEAVFERDSVLLDRPEYPFFLIACLLYVATLKDRVLNVLDFGGALGSSYFQCRKFLTPLKHLRWDVVEQKKHVERGRRYLEDDILHFYHTIEECLTYGQPDVTILSGVMHFIDRPYELIKKVIEFQFDYVVVDRQPLSSRDKERLCVMTVPPSIIPVSYPCWFLSEKRFREAWSGGYKLEAESEEAAPLVVDGDVMPRKRFFYSRVR